MIIYGTRMYWKRNVVNGWGYCDHCGAYGRNRSYNGRKWGHLYFIPLIPSGDRVRVVKECRRCSYGRHVQEQAVPAILENMRRSAVAALEALAAGRRDFEDDGNPLPCAERLAGMVDVLFSLNAEFALRSILTTLQEGGQAYAYNLVSGRALSFQGQHREAAAAYKRAAEAEPANPLPLVWLGDTHVIQKDYESAKSIYRKALDVSENKLPVLQALTGIYEKLKDYARLAETYEACFLLVPGLSKDGKMLKAYQKACKKAGRRPVAG